MLFSSNFDRRKVKPLIYIKFWRQACLPTLLYGTELFALTPTLLAKVERCQQWFLKNVFYVPKFAPCQLLLKWSGLLSIDSEIGLRKLLFLGRLLTGIKWHLLSVIFFKSGLKAILMLTLFLWEFCQVYVRHCTNMDSSVILTHGSQILCFPTYSQRKSIVKTKIREFEENTWKNFVIAHPSYKLAETCLDLVSPEMFWSNL